MGDSTSPGT